MPPCNLDHERDSQEAGDSRFVFGGFRLLLDQLGQSHVISQIEFQSRSNSSTGRNAGG